MKKYLTIYAIFCITIFAGLLLLFLMPAAIQDQEINILAINEITTQAAIHWHEPSELSHYPFSYHFFLLDNENNVIFSSNKNLPNNMVDALRSDFVPLDVIIGSSIVGKALVETSPTNALIQNYDRIRIYVFSAFILLIILNGVFLWILHHALIAPFTRLKGFAQKIAASQFDAPLPMDRRNIFGPFTQSFDIMRSSLREAQYNHLKAERAKQELIASLTHDLKTPVTSIRLIAELLQAGTSEPGTKEKLNTIEQKADQIDRLMNDLMQSALDELGELKVNAESVESSVLMEIFKDADPLNKLKITTIPPCLIELDILRMRQIIGNIIINSYKYAGTDIEVGFQLCGELMQVDIQDYGPGVLPEEEGLVTTKFYRGKNAKLSQKEGEGLGLYIAKILMEKMGGSLEAVNSGGGFVVRVWVRLS